MQNRCATQLVEHLPGIGFIDRREAKSEVVHDVRVRPAATRHQTGSENGIPLRADHELFPATRCHLLHQHAINDRTRCPGAHVFKHRTVALPQVMRIANVEHHAAGIPFVHDIRRDDFQAHRKVQRVRNRP